MKHYEVVCAVIINDNNQIFITQRGPDKALPFLWEFPGGKIEIGETKEEAIIREIKEELESTIDPYKYIGEVSYDYIDIEKPFGITLYAYACKLVDGKLTLTEHVKGIWVNVEDLDKYDFAAADKLIINILKI